ncbi:MAG: ATP-binding cassette domain-containing protein [Lachnospiraceae bacterium]|nr:ATP-binding cassette domain-containing protein [Lachnospiraceae bacterium]
MLNIFRYLKQFKGTVLIIFLLLMVQAWCDLALPTYTSNIVDVGISQNGIEETVPKQIRESSMEDLKLFLEEEEGKLLDDCYEKTNQTVKTKPSMIGAKAVEKMAEYAEQMQQNGGNDQVTAAQNGQMKEDPSAMIAQLSQGLEEIETPIYELKKQISQEKIEELEKLLEKPEMFYGMMNAALMEGENASSEKMEITEEEMQEISSQVMEMISPQTQVSRRKEILDTMMRRYESMWDTMSKSLTAMYIKGEYEAAGINMEEYQKDYLLFTGFKMLGVAMGVMVTMIIVGLLASKAAAGAAMNLRTKMFANVLRFSNKELDQFSTASLITRSTNDIQQIQMVLVMLMRMILYAPILGIGAVFKILNDGKASMAWIIVVAVAAILCLVGVLFAVAMPKFKKMQILVDKLNQVAREILTGIPVIRAFSREDHEEQRFEAANKNLMRTQLFTSRVMTTMMPAMMLIMYLVNIMILWFGAKGINAGDLQVGDMMAFITYTMQIIMSFLMLTMMSIMLPRAGVAAKRIDEVISAEPSIVDQDNAKTVTKEGFVTFDHVSFAYPGAEGNVLTDISFTAEPGKTTAIIGGAGSGKSTLVNLIPRFYDVTEGKILIDGTDVREVRQAELRSLLGYVPQKGVLFSGTIESNIKFGNLTASEELMKESAAIAQAADFIEEKNDQYESGIAQGGTNVSGGQKQRLSIARAIAREPKIYIFDDSFSALDFKTDAALRKALKEKTKDSTVLIVAQRISTIMHAEQILVLDDGKLVGKGTHQELLRNCEVYEQIASSQLSQQEIEETKRAAGGKEASHE